MQPRFDASESAFFARQLETIDQTIYMQQFALLKARELLPLITSVGPNDLEYTWRKFTTSGKAHILGDKATDLTVAAVKGQEETSRIKDIEDMFTYSIPEIRAAASRNMPLDDLNARAARQAHETKIDELLAFGSALDTNATGMRGFVNSDDLVDYTTFAPTVKDGGSDHTWTVVGADPAKIIADVTSFVAQLSGQLQQAQGIQGKYTLVLPLTHYALIAGMPASTLVTRSVLDYILTNPLIEAVVPWTKLTGAKHGGSGQRMIIYVRDPMVLGGLVPLNFTRQPEQYDGLQVKIPCWSRCGGAVIRYPVAMAYGDGI